MYATNRRPGSFLSLGLLAAAVSLSLGACALNGVQGNDNIDRIPSSDPAFDARLDALGIICETTLTVSGTYTQTEAPPPDHGGGCWDVGTWAVKTTVNFLGCDPQETLEQEYVFNVWRDDDSYSYVDYMGQWNDDPERLNLKITNSGDGLCHGNFEMFRSDGVVLSFFPTLQPDGTLTGDGAFDVWEEDPF